MPKMMGYAPVDPAERRVWTELKKQLPPDWVVVPNASWSRRTSGPAGHVRDGEADFVVLAPGLGFVVLEVKGSRAVRIDEHGTWLRRDPGTGRDVPLDRSPVQQAMSNMHQLKDVFQHHLARREFPGNFGFAVVYPNGAFPVGHAMPPLLDASTVVMRDHLSDLGGRIRSILVARGADELSRSSDPSAADVKSMADALVHRPFEVVPTPDADELDADIDGIQRLMPQQFAALQGVFRHRRVAVTGPAGSGKTVLGLWRLKAAIAAGEDAIYVCFNKSLAEHIAVRDPAIAPHVRNVDSLLREVLKRAGLEIPRAPVPIDDVYFSETVPNAILVGAYRIPPSSRYDVIIVDEGQDFGESRLVALQELLRAEDSAWVYFADQVQDIYRRGGAEDVGATVGFGLSHNCRNTVSINETQNALTRQSIPSMPGMPQGQEPFFFKAASAAGVCNKAWELAKEWSSGGASVVILSPFTLERSSLRDKVTGHGLSLSTAPGDVGKPGTVVFSTIKSFKGIEADAVILVDVPRPVPDSGFTPQDMYVACTRARARLAIISTTVDEGRWREDLAAAVL